MGAVACSKSDGPETDALRQKWNEVSARIEQAGDFDPATVPSVLTEGLLSSTSCFRCKGDEMSDNVPLWPGGNGIDVIFYENGTCWNCWWDMPHLYDGGLFYRAYRWRYEEGVLVTWNEYSESKAIVRAVDGNTIIFDGDICSNIGVDGSGYRDPEVYLRIVMERKDGAARERYIGSARNIEDFEQAE